MEPTKIGLSSLKKSGIKLGCYVAFYLALAFLILGTSYWSLAVLLCILVVPFTLPGFVRAIRRFVGELGTLRSMRKRDAEMIAQGRRDESWMAMDDATRERILRFEVSARDCWTLEEFEEGPELQTAIRLYMNTKAWCANIIAETEPGARPVLSMYYRYMIRTDAEEFVSHAFDRDVEYRAMAIMNWARGGKGRSLRRLLMKMMGDAKSAGKLLQTCWLLYEYAEIRGIEPRDLLEKWDFDYHAAQLCKGKPEAAKALAGDFRSDYETACAALERDGYSRALHTIRSHA